MFPNTITFPPARRLASVLPPPSEQIVVRLDGRGSRLYFPGETLSGSYYLNEIRESSICAVEISILWQTEGKGNEDVGTHSFWSLSSQNGDWIDPEQPGRFRSVLPQSPLTYEGTLIKIRWRVRVRAFLTNGKQLVDEAPFRLGNLPDMRTLKTTVEFAEFNEKKRLKNENASSNEASNETLEFGDRSVSNPSSNRVRESDRLVRRLSEN